MKHFLMMTAALALTLSAFAQPPMPPQVQGKPDRMPQMFEQRDPEQMAKDETDRLDRLVTLTEKQYKKIYKFNKRMYNQLQNQMESLRPAGRPEGMGRPDGMGPGGPGFGGERPQGMGPGGPGGMGPGDPRGGEFRRPLLGGDMQELMDEQQAKRVKKYRKVLTPEQFQKWESFEAEREFRRMVERPE